MWEWVIFFSVGVWRFGGLRVVFFFVPEVHVLLGYFYLSGVVRVSVVWVVYIITRGGYGGDY